MKPWSNEPHGYRTLTERHRYQARPSWELERSLRRAALRRGVLIALAGVALALIAYLFLLTLLSIA